jgi:hypothetical protein
MKFKPGDWVKDIEPASGFVGRYQIIELAYKAPDYYAWRVYDPNPNNYSHKNITINENFFEIDEMMTFLQGNKK